MATLTIRNLPDEIRDKLRVRAAKNRRSMEAEARRILEDSCGRPDAEKRLSAPERIARAQAAFASYRDPSRSLVDELLAERREASARGD